MEQKYDLNDICDEIGRILDNDITQTLRSTGCAVVGLANPAVGAVAGIGNDILVKYNKFKLSFLLRGLSSGSNTEKRLNQLYRYVKSSPNKAIIVANLFKQTINAECPKVCVVYGLILAKHSQSFTELTHDEMIVCKALENATDYDLENFKVIMDKYFIEISTKKRVSFPKELGDTTSLTSTCDWCVYNRLFVYKMPGSDEMKEGSLDLTSYYYETNSANVLLNYINDAMTIWNYN